MPKSLACLDHRLDSRLESVERALALAYQQLLVDPELIDETATAALAEILHRAQNDARIVSQALPAPLRMLAVEDDYEGPNVGGEPLQLILDLYRKRAGADALAAAMNGSRRSRKAM